MNTLHVFCDAVCTALSESVGRGDVPSQAGATSVNTISNKRGGAFRHGVASIRGKTLKALVIGGGLCFGAGGHAFAQATSPANGIGAQLNLMSGEAINSGSTAFGAACYLAATICFGLGVWALWQSRQPQNREAGHIGKGVAGLVLCGLFAAGGVWINKAAVSASGGSATINDNAAMVQFGSGG
jgi:hypothetical protein